MLSTAHMLPNGRENTFHVQTENIIIIQTIRHVYSVYTSKRKQTHYVHWCLKSKRKATRINIIILQRIHYTRRVTYIII